MKKSKFLIAILVMALSSTSAFADITNGNFETGTYTAWSSVSGTAFVPPPSGSPYYNLVSWEGTYFVNSAFNTNETAIGVLRSDTFTYSSDSFINFFIAGYSTHL